MIKTTTLLKRLALAAALAVGVFDVPDAGASQYTMSRSPIWQVGLLNKALSDACQRGTFNQLKIQNINIGYIGAEGRGVTGAAMRDWNLRDPRRLAEGNVTYHFYNDGYSNCRVYVARFKPRRN
ncbi:MAG: hypothetical protein ACTSV1_05465 [Alphaproteobacteria bacterium]